MRNDQYVPPFFPALDEHAFPTPQETLRLEMLRVRRKARGRCLDPRDTKQAVDSEIEIVTAISGASNRDR